MIKIVVRTLKVGEVVKHEVFEVSSNRKSQAALTFRPPRECLSAFVKGVRAGAVACGVFNIELVDADAPKSTT
jgi:hypothetical protein